ncbi:hypothetical protein [Pseudonocardia sp.]|jgi:pyruvate,orthophosphate dikinase|uniref:hypothetical protein n=1 Tax=Pseudonocardia sp. TaxID=60912 RepID=UPI002637DDE2|nr:hypothetical protein [Pseudonocardia sp.]MCW2721752.1 ppdK [Pseudonocardia sp.]
MDELAVLRIVAVKGRVAAAEVADSLGLDVSDVGRLGDRLVADGAFKETLRGWRLSEDGRARAAEALDRERAGIDHDALAAAYDEFCVLNGELKQIVTDWQLRDGVPNDHADTGYDSGVLARLGDLHRRARPLVGRVGEIAPWTARYVARFDRADREIAAGDTAWVARPIMDSYHTVWFELHEDLIGLLGLTRSEEAAAGRAH